MRVSDLYFAPKQEALHNTCGNCSVSKFGQDWHVTESKWMVFRGTFWDLAEVVASFSCLYSDLCIFVIIFPLLIPANFVKWYSVLFAILGNWWNFIVVRQAKELILSFSSRGKIAKVGKGAHEPKAQTAEAVFVAWSMPRNIATLPWTGC